MQDTSSKICSLACRNLLKCIRQVDIWEGIAFVYTSYQIHLNQQRQRYLPGWGHVLRQAFPGLRLTTLDSQSITIHGVLLDQQLTSSLQHAWRELPYLPQNGGQRFMPVGRRLCCGWTRLLCCGRQDMLGSEICICYNGLASVSAGGGKLHVMWLCNVTFVCKASGPPSCCVLLIDKHTTSNELTKSPNLKVSVPLITSCGTFASADKVSWKQ